MERRGAKAQRFFLEKAKVAKTLCFSLCSLLSRLNDFAFLRLCVL